MLNILIVASGPYRVTLRSTGVDLMPTDDALTPSHYDIRPYSRRGYNIFVIRPCMCSYLGLRRHNIHHRRALAYPNPFQNYHGQGRLLSGSGPCDRWQVRNNWRGQRWGL
ncbi:hypothetical protein V1506DRAFT_531798 [Lipomyces tetrasporus]